MKNAVALFLLFFCMVYADPVQAQGEPRIEGLVLGGGGARGLAHAGAVEAMERLGRDADIVVGTSMGAIIGALYAAGYDAAAIRAVVTGENWGGLFSPMPLLLGADREVRYPLLRLDLEFVRGRGGAGLIADWRINRVLARLFFDAQARSRGDFDRLPRRFRAVTADLLDGRMVVMGEGDLARAVRASMAVPGVFAPIAWDGRLLVDGGIANYLPVSVARELGADHVVAVDVIRPTLTDNELDPIDIALRGLRLTLLNTLPSDSPPDELVLPPVPASATEAAFTRDPSNLLGAGLSAALATLGPPVGAVRARVPAPPPAVLGPLRIDVADPALAAVARAAFRDVAPGPYDPDAVLRAVDRLYATGLFDGVWPAVEPGSTDAEPTPLRLRLEPMEPAALVGAAGYDNDRGTRGWAALTGRPGLGVPTEIRAVASSNSLERWADFTIRRFVVGRPPLVWSVAGHVREREIRPFTAEPAGTRVLRTGASLGLETRRLSPGLLLLGTLRADHIQVRDGATGHAAGPLLRASGIEPVARIVGVQPLLEGEIRFGSFDYQRFGLAGSLDRSRGRLLFAALADLAAARGGAPPDALPALGDQRLVPALRWGEERGANRIATGIDLASALPLPIDLFTRLRLRAGAAADRVGDFGHRDRWLAGAELGLLLATPVAPVSLALGANTRGTWRLDFDIGPRF